MVELGFPRRILWGERAADAISGLLSVWGAKRVLVISDNIIVGLPLVREIIESLKASYEVKVFSNVPAEPPSSVAEEAAGLARSVDVVIAIGGGSVIDVAKAATVLAKRPGLSVSDVAPFNPLGVEFEKPYLVAVPTTAGTGSDASYGIVLVAEGPGGERVKIAVGSFEVVPHASVLDPELPKSAPRHVSVGAVVDALSHALESIASTASNPFSEALAEKAAGLIFTVAPRALRVGEGWDLLHAAATMAGMAFTNSGLGLAHAIAHPLGGLLGLHHGSVVGVIMLRVLPLYEKAQGSAERLQRLKIMLESVYALPERESLTGHVRALYEQIGAATSLAELGVSRADLERVASKAAELALHDPDIAFSPVIPGPEEIEEIILSSYK